MKTTTFFLKARKKLNLKQNEMAKDLGIRRVNLCKYERGFTDPPAQLVLDVIQRLKIKLF